MCLPTDSPNVDPESDTQQVSLSRRLPELSSLADKRGLYEQKGDSLSK